VPRYSRDGLVIDRVDQSDLDLFRLRIEVSGFSLDPGLAQRQELALQQIIDEGAARNIEVVVQSVGS